MPKRRWLNREHVIAKAVEMADNSRTLETVSLKTLAEALDIRTPSLYNHIMSLEDLHKGMALWGLQQLLITLRQDITGKVGRPALEAIANAYRHFAHCAR